MSPAPTSTAIWGVGDVVGWLNGLGPGPGCVGRAPRCMRTANRRRTAPRPPDVRLPIDLFIGRNGHYPSTLGRRHSAFCTRSIARNCPVCIDVIVAASSIMPRRRSAIASSCRRWSRSLPAEPPKRSSASSSSCIAAASATSSSTSSGCRSSTVPASVRSSAATPRRSAWEGRCGSPRCRPRPRHARAREPGERLRHLRFDRGGAYGLVAVASDPHRDRRGAVLCGALVWAGPALAERSSPASTRSPRRCHRRSQERAGHPGPSVSAVHRAR